MLARERFPKGTLVSGATEVAVQETQKLLGKPEPVYEATFLHDDLLCKVDVLTKNGSGVDIIEVKSSTSLKYEYLYDIAFQTHVLRKAGVVVNSSYLLHINPAYNREGDIDLEQLFILVDVSKKIKPILATIEEGIQSLFAFLEKQKPVIEPGKHCKDTKCPLALKANKELPENNVTQLYRNNGQKFLGQGIVKISDIHEGIGLNKKQLVQYEATKTNTTHVDKQNLTRWLDGLTFPIIHLDFETIDFAVPEWDNTKPYLHVPFQYSIHIQHEDGTVEHKEYLHDGADDPRPELLEHMKRDLPDDGTVLAYYATFEKGRLQELAMAFPDDEVWINGVLARLDDLIIPFQNFWYYDPKQYGSCSIKYVLPALVGTSYDGMAVANGTEAQVAYEKLMTNPSDKEQLMKDMLLYCEQDTKAMVDILNVLVNSVK